MGGSCRGKGLTAAVSSSPGPLDVRRLLARFIVLVVVPALGLIGFGVVAISNERAVVEKRFDEESLARLKAVASNLASSIDEAAAGATPSDAAIVAFDFKLTPKGLETSREIEPEVFSALVDTLRSATMPPRGSVALMPVTAGAARGLYAVRSDEADSVRGVAFSEKGLARFVETEGRRLFPTDPAQWSLQPRASSTEWSTNPMRRVLDEFAQPRSTPGQTSLTLPGPLADWRIVTELPGDDPVSRALWRNRTIYIVALAIFYIVIITGVVVTLRGISREARLSRMKTDFVSNISHELRTPLTSIRLFAETLRLGRATTEEERNACLDLIVTESERLSALTERTLEWGRLEAGGRSFERVPTTLQALVLPVVDGLVARGVVSRNVVGIDLPDTLPEVEIDPSAMAQVVLNLLENAVKYSGGALFIAIRGRADKKRVRLEIEDNGVGIARRDQKRIFERFYRADDLLARRTEGSGLGLSIARRIVAAHGGRLRVSSRPSHGATFTVELPRHKPPKGASSR